MPSNVDTVKSELSDLGYETKVIESPNGRTIVSFPYTIEMGPHKGTHVVAGVAFHPGEEGYPEYPPHWVCVTPPLNDGKGGAVEDFQDDQGRKWLAMSRPPKDIWDKLTPRDMKGYIREHLSRVWA